MSKIDLDVVLTDATNLIVTLRAKNTALKAKLARVSATINEDDCGYAEADLMREKDRYREVAAENERLRHALQVCVDALDLCVRTIDINHSEGSSAIVNAGGSRKLASAVLGRRLP